MQNFIKLHYAITIDTGNPLLNDPNIGLDNGVLRYISDGYTITTDTYEDLSPVTGVWNKNLLVKEGIKTSSTNIDIITNGNYAFLANIEVELTDVNVLHKSILTMDELYVIGKPLKFYIIINKKWYSRGVFSVSEYQFNGKTFKWVAKDLNNSDNKGVPNTNFGYNQSMMIPVEENVVALISKKFFKNYEPTEKTLSPFNYVRQDGYDINSVDAYYVGSHPNSKAIIENKETSYFIRLNGYYPTIKENMYLSFEGNNQLHLITKVELLEELSRHTVQTDISVIIDDIVQFTQITIQEAITDILDETQFFGWQPKGVTTDIIFNTEKYLDTTSLINIYEKGLYFPPIEGGYTIVDGQIQVRTSDGAVIWVDVVENADTSVTIKNTKYVATKLPKSIKYYGGTGNDTFSKNLNTGNAQHVERYVKQKISIPNDLNADGQYTTFGEFRYHYFLLEFDDDVIEMNPFIIANSMVDAREIWEIGWRGYQDNQPDKAIFFSQGFLTGLGYTTYYSPIVNDDYKAMNSLYRTLTVDAFTITDDVQFGMMPLLNNEASFIVPNVRSRWNYERSNELIATYVKSVPTTNIPLTSITTSASCVSTYSELQSWKTFFNTATQNNYPVAKIIDYVPNSPITSSKRIMLRLSSENFETGADDTEVLFVYDGITHPYQIDLNKLIIGVNSIGVYKEYTITSLADVSVQTHVSATDTIPKILDYLTSATTPTNLPYRDGWFVGGQTTQDENNFDLIQQILKSSFLGGYTNRNGESVFIDWITSLNLDYSLTTDNIIDGSISDMKLSPIEKCYNEVTIKYNLINNEYTKEIGVYHVDADQFPSEYSYTNDVWGDEYDTRGQQFLWFTEYLTDPQFVEVSRALSPDIIDAFANNPYDKYKMTLNVTAGEISFSNVRLWSVGTTHNDYTYDVINQIINVPSLSASTVSSIATNQTETGYEWQNYVTGIPSYPDSRALWNKFHTCWMINQRIRLAPTDITDLKMAVDLNSYYNSVDYDFYSEYAYSYANIFGEWATLQKLQLSCSIPITEEFIMMELLDRIRFADPLVTPTSGDYGYGWITSIGVDPYKGQMKIGICFEPRFMSNIPPFCSNYIEKYDNIDWIVETGNPADDNIVEPCQG